MSVYRDSYKETGIMFFNNLEDETEDYAIVIINMQFLIISFGSRKKPYIPKSSETYFTNKEYQDEASENMDVTKIIEAIEFCLAFCLAFSEASS